MFPDLKILSLLFRVAFAGSAESLRIIFLNILQVQEMQIQRLVIKANPQTPLGFRQEVRKTNLQNKAKL